MKKYIVQKLTFKVKGKQQTLHHLQRIMMKVKCNAQQLKDSVAQKNLAINLKAASLFFGPVFPSLMSGNLTAKQLKVIK